MSWIVVGNEDFSVEIEEQYQRDLLAEAEERTHELQRATQPEGDVSWQEHEEYQTEYMAWLNSLPF